MTNLEKLHLNHLCNSLDYAIENLTSLDLLQVRNIIHLLKKTIKDKTNEKSDENETNRK